MKYNDLYIYYKEFDSLEDLYDYVDNEGYKYAISPTSSLNPSPIKVNGIWCLEVTSWSEGKPSKREQYK